MLEYSNLSCGERLALNICTLPFCVIPAADDHYISFSRGDVITDIKRVSDYQL